MYQQPFGTSGPEEPGEQELPQAWDADIQPTWDDSWFSHDQGMEMAFHMTPSYEGYLSYWLELADESPSPELRRDTTNQPLQEGSTTTSSFFQVDQTTMSSMWSDQDSMQIDSREQGSTNETPYSPSSSYRVESGPSYEQVPNLIEPPATSTIESLWGSQSLLAATTRPPGSDSRYSLLQASVPITSTRPSLVTPDQGQQSQAYPPRTYVQQETLTRSLTPIARPSSGASTFHQGHRSQPPSPNSSLIQLGASQRHLINNQPAPWIRALDVDRSYRPPRTPSPSTRPVLCLYVRIPDYEPYHRALYLRERTVHDFVNRMSEKYGLNAIQRSRIARVVIRTPIGIVPVDDNDINALRNETEMHLKCAPIEGLNDMWQLELS